MEYAQDIEQHKVLTAHVHPKSPLPSRAHCPSVPLDGQRRFSDQKYVRPKDQRRRRGKYVD
eukprot:4869201-Pyramimonas_sp.AAC.1